MNRELRLSDDLVLPIDVVTQTIAILAKRGVGKTYTASVMVEEMLMAGLHVVILDPVGVWWGLRSSVDGKSDGLPILIMGGKHADVPLDKSSGSYVADMIISERLPVILDLSDMSKNAQSNFVAEFGERLYQKNTEPLHLVLDEADAFAPQRTMPNETRMLGAIDTIVRRGRAKGLGVTLISQRPAVLNKNVLTQTEILITLRITGPQDRSAIKDWISAYGDEEQGKELLESLASLPIGNAWIWSPGWLDIFQRMRVRPRKTFDSSATPKVGSKKIEPKIAEIDMEAIRSRMSEVIEQAKNEDPAELRKRIKDLERQLAAKPKPAEVPVIPEIIITGINNLNDCLMNALAQLENIITNIPGKTESSTEKHIKSADTPPIVEQLTNVPEQNVNLKVDNGLSNPQQRILDTLARFELAGMSDMERSNLAVLSDQSPRSSGYAKNVSTLRTLGLIDYPRLNCISLTDDGRKRTNSVVGIRSRDELHAAWYSKISRPQAAILKTLIDIYPDVLSRTDLAQIVGQSATSSGYAKNVSTLSSLKLVDYPASGLVAATALLFPEGLREGGEH